MNYSRFEYFLNAVHYCLWLYEMKFDIKLAHFIRSFVNCIIYPISRIFFTKEYRKKYYVGLAERRKELDKRYIDKKGGICVVFAHQAFDGICSGYPFFLSFILGALAIKFYGDFNSYLFLFMAVIPAIPCYILVDKMVFTNDRYLKYFKKFEKEDEAWHKKWKKRTMLFIIGSIIMTLLGIAAMFAIWILIPEP